MRVFMFDTNQQIEKKNVYPPCQSFLLDSKRLTILDYTIAFNIGCVGMNVSQNVSNWNMKNEQSSVF